MQTILITGSSGLIGTELLHLLKENTDPHTVLLFPTHQELDLLDQKATFEYFKTHRPTHVYHLAAVVGGIAYNNSMRGIFIYQNTQMQLNVLEGCRLAHTQIILFPGSACSYPVDAPQPVLENTFLMGHPEETNIAYALAKINGIVACQSYQYQYGIKCVLPFPTNAYGNYDHTDQHTAHVIPALFTRMYDAKKNNDTEFILWGTGLAKREFIHAIDVAKSFIFLMNRTDVYGDIINVGTGEEITILNLAKTIASIVGYKGKIIPDPSKPTGVLRKCLNSDKMIRLGFKPSIPLQEGLQQYWEHVYDKK